MADLKTNCSACDADIVVHASLVSEEEDVSYKCHKCSKL